MADLGSTLSDNFAPNWLPFFSPEGEILSFMDINVDCDICETRLAVTRPADDANTEAFAVLPCGHVFGAECIRMWLDSKSSNGTCPSCRRSLQFRDCGHDIEIKSFEFRRGHNMKRAIEECIFEERDGPGDCPDCLSGREGVPPPRQRGGNDEIGLGDLGDEEDEESSEDDFHHHHQHNLRNHRHNHLNHHDHHDHHNHHNHHHHHHPLPIHASFGRIHGDYGHGGHPRGRGHGEHQLFNHTPTGNPFQDPFRDRTAGRLRIRPEDVQHAGFPYGAPPRSSSLPRGRTAPSDPYATQQRRHPYPGLSVETTYPDEEMSPRTRHPTPTPSSLRISLEEFEDLREMCESELDESGMADHLTPEQRHGIMNMLMPRVFNNPGYRWEPRNDSSRRHGHRH